MYALEAIIETKLPETTASQERFFQTLDEELWCELAKRLDLAS